MRLVTDFLADPAELHSQQLFDLVLLFASNDSCFMSAVQEIGIGFASHHVALLDQHTM